MDFQSNVQRTGTIGTGGWDISATTALPVTSSVGLIKGLVIQVEDEIVVVDEITSATVITVRERGAAGTTAATHAAAVAYTVIGSAIELPPVMGCIVHKKKSILRPIKINPATGRQCVKLSSRGDYVWALKEVFGMTLGNCPDCWENICECGAKYKNAPTERIERLIETLQSIVIKRKEVVKNKIVYRLGIGNHHTEKDGKEITEITEVSFTEFLEDTERKLKKEISVVSVTPLRN